MGNFQDTYVRPGNSWDLKGCHQKPNESLRDATCAITVGAIITATTPSS